MVEQSQGNRIPERCIGLTGSIASGKSEVSKILKQTGRFQIIDADLLIHELYTPETPTAQAIKTIFGTLDRKKISSQVFANPDLKTQLEGILHPAVAVLSTQRMKELSQQHPDQWIVYDAALLIESGRAADFQGRLLLVTADEEIRVQRLMNRNGKTKDEALKIIRSQMPDNEKRNWATWEITNNGNLNQLAHSVFTWMSKACPG